MPTRADAARLSASRPRARRPLAALAAILVGLITTVLVGLPAAAQGEPDQSADPAASPTTSGPPIGPATAGTPVCTVNNPELDEVTGMVATANGIYAVEGGSTERPGSVEIWTINATTCEATVESYGFFPIDPQDLALGADNALWVADIGPGASGGEREWLTLERVDPAAGSNAVPYRTLVPPNAPVTGSAMLLDANNIPIIIANTSDGAVLYQPNGPLPADTTQGLPTLQQVGTFQPINTDTATPRGTFGRLVVTGAAVSPDRTKVVLRTESDAYEFTVPDGDIVRAITQGTPVITPLPEEPNGLAITYSADGTQFLTLTSTPNPVLRAYRPHVPQPAAPTQPPASGGGGGITFGDITKIALATGFLGLVAVVVGIVGIVRFRRQHPASFQTRARADRARSRDDDRWRDRARPARERRESAGWDDEEDYEDEYEREREYDHEYDESRARPSRPPRPRVGTAQGSAGTAYGSGGATYGSSAAAYGSGSSGTTYGSGGTTYGSSGTTYSSSKGGTTYGSSSRSSGSSGTTYGSGGSRSGSSGTTYGSGGTTYGSGGRSSSSSGRASVPGGRASVPGDGGGGGVYGRPRPEPDDEDFRSPYGRDNIDL